MMRELKMHLRRGVRVAAFGAVLGTLVGCDDFMRVTNPGAIEPPALEDEAYINLMVHGVIGDFQPTFAWTALWSGVFADELRNHHGYFQNGEIDRRAIGENNGTYAAAVYNGLHRTRFLADSVSGRLKTLYADSAGSQLHVARTLTYAGYTWMLLGEQYCQTPINRSEPQSSAQLLTAAVSRFEEAIAVAQAARSAAAGVENAKVRAARIAGADSLENFARVGAARAALGLADQASFRTKALEHARAVTPAYGSPTSEGFRFEARYVRDGERYTRRLSSPFYEFIRAGRWFSISDTPFQGLDDPRVPHADTLYRAADGTQRTFANSPKAFSTYSGTESGRGFDAETTIRLASALEARYIIAELEGLNAANLMFINERREIGGQGVLVTTSEAEYQAAVRDQRSRDFFLDGHRMGDLRRYKAQYGVDLWPRGAYFGHASLVYGDQECWPVPISETY